MMDIPGVPPHRKIDKPSDSDFFRAIEENLPDKAHTRNMVLGITAAYYAGKAIKKRGTKKS